MHSLLRLLFLACLVQAFGTIDAAEKPNVILFLVDDMGWMDSTPYGSKFYETPNMERFAKQSMRFTDAYALPLCSPTRASILTGQYSSRHGITSASGHQSPQPEGLEFMPATANPRQPLRMPISKNYLDPSHYTLAEALRDAGYATGHFGKWHLGLTQPHWPDQHGFDVAWHSQPSPGPPGFYFSPYGVVPPGTPRPNNPRVKHYAGTITDGPDGEYITDRLTDEAIQFMEESRGRPFFLNIWHFGVHGPWGHKEEYTADFANKNDPTGRQGNAVMASMLKSIDESLGRVLDKLEQLGIADNTMFIFYSDNGGNTHSMTEKDTKAGRNKSANPSVVSYRKWAGYKPPTNNAPLREGKGKIYEGGQRVPLMVRWPGRIAAGTTTDAVVGPIDLYPTILDGVKIQSSQTQVIDGESIMPLLTGSGELKREAYFTWFPHLIPAVSVRQAEWKLIRRFQPHRDYPELLELYDLESDIGETRNLASEMPDKVKELDVLIDQFVVETNALYPQPNPAYKPGVSFSERAQASPTAGLVPKFCKATLNAEVLRIEADGRTPFLGTAQVRMAGPLKLKLRVRSHGGGVGRVRWKMPEQESFPESSQMVDFNIAAGSQWQEIAIAVPVNGKASIVRLYLPAKESPVGLQLIEFSNERSQVKEWRFGPRE
ncbi:MAG: sulfatase [Planctomycetota bacterium]